MQLGKEAYEASLVRMWVHPHPEGIAHEVPVLKAFEFFTYGKQCLFVEKHGCMRTNDVHLVSVLVTQVES